MSLKFNQPFQPLAPLPTHEEAMKEHQRSEAHLKDTMVLTDETILGFKAANWLTKIEVSAIFGHIYTLERQIEELKKEKLLVENSNTFVIKEMRASSEELIALRKLNVVPRPIVWICAAISSLWDRLV